MILLSSSCTNKKPRVIPECKPYPVEVLVDKYVPVPKELTARSEPVYSLYPIWFKTATWLDLHFEDARTLEHCNNKLELIESLTTSQEE